MLPAVLDLSAHREPDIFEFLYPFFHRDFVCDRVLLANRYYVNPQAQGVRDGKEEVFWHITTREQTYRVKQGKQHKCISARRYDPNRSCRIEWIKPMLLNHKSPSFRCFYRKETSGKKPIRFYIWAHSEDFVVIVQKLGRSEVYLVTSFYITETYKRSSYQKWYAEYCNAVNPDLMGCEWF